MKKLFVPLLVVVALVIPLTAITPQPTQYSAQLNTSSQVVANAMPSIGIADAEARDSASASCQSYRYEWMRVFCYWLEQQWDCVVHHDCY